MAFTIFASDLLCNLFSKFCDDKFAGGKFVQNSFFFFFRPVSDAEPLRVKEYDIEGNIILNSI